MTTQNMRKDVHLPSDLCLLPLLLVLSVDGETFLPNDLGLWESATFIDTSTSFLIITVRREQS
jgi:hypothetical protein